MSPIKSDGKGKKCGSKNDTRVVDPGFNLTT
ncbi:hypothetical protein Sinac_5719 [Singulisphaera acidiphila DSM 18658]|uniref:Uncharacterized protein n=1 Tax=Singulisphaera acidiphila (strain ATCC BAA-1392 / DSM 18658 / VKM B-2454 / MOB10) TaxID=886293 RepID=L0DM01_SINAD|nr:hypothetical protein Sinac_5719 [Singulisphaera acidiphila DSM 18658]